jgi:hypothetical protein
MRRREEIDLLKGTRKARLLACLGVSTALLALASPAAAHIVVVGPSGESHWIGGGPLPQAAENGQGLVINPFGAILPASHFTGLPHACIMLMANASAVAILAPPSFTGCQHGQ